MTESTLPIDDAFSDLVARYLDDALSDGEYAALSERLNESAQLRRYLWIACRIAQQRHDFGRQAIPAAPTVREPAGASRRTPAPTNRYLLPAALSLVAAILLVAAVVAVYLVAGSIDRNDRRDNPDAGPPVATLVESDGPVLIGDDLGNPGQQYAAGPVIVERGSAEFISPSGASIHLSGSSELNINGSMSATFIRGTVRFRCPAQARGYTVFLPNGVRVVDLGTEFTIKSDAKGGGSRVSVSEGRVSVLRGNQTMATLSAGQAVAIADGGAVGQVAAASTADAYAAAVASDAPIAYWPLDEAAGLETVRDATGNGYDGAPSGVRFAEPGPFAESTAAAFDGNGIIDAGERPEMALVNDFSIEAWVWIDGDVTRLGSIATAVNRQNSQVAGGWILGYEQATETRPSRLILGFQRARSAIFNDPPIEPRRWTHVVVTHDASNVTRLYVDGQIAGVERSAGAGLPDRVTLAIGKYAAGYGGWRGRLAHVAVYDRTLTDAQVAAHAAAADKE